MDMSHRECNRHTKITYKLQDIRDYIKRIHGLKRCNYSRPYAQ